MTVKVDKTIEISGTRIKLEELRALVRASSSMDGNADVKIHYTPRDRPFDSESYSISVTGPDMVNLQGRD